MVYQLSVTLEEKYIFIALKSQESREKNREFNAIFDDENLPWPIRRECGDIKNLYKLLQDFTKFEVSPIGGILRFERFKLPLGKLNPLEEMNEISS